MLVKVCAPDVKKWSFISVTLNCSKVMIGLGGSLKRYKAYLLFCTLGAAVDYNSLKMIILVVESVTHIPKRKLPSAHEARLNILDHGLYRGERTRCQN